MRVRRLIKSFILKIKVMLTKPTVVIPDENSYERVSFKSFSDIIEYLTHMTTLDEGRHIIHYLFQGMYDLLGTVSNSEVHYLYKKVVRTGTKYYASYYRGEGDISIIKALLPYLGVLTQYNDNYYYKIRGNFDYGSSIMQPDIARFLQGAINSSFNYDVIVGIATSASEPAMALAGLLNLPLEFVRYSKRRSDGSVTVLDFMAEEIRTECVAKNALVIDDWVASGNSMQRCMKYVQGLGALQVRGATIEDNGNDMDIKTIESTQNFKLYE